VISAFLGAALALSLGAGPPLAAGGSLAEALAQLPPGETLRLGPGEHRGSLGRLDRPGGVRVEGAGAGLTVILVPPGEDGAVALGELWLTGLSIVAGPNRSALKVLGGAAVLEDVALLGGAAGAFVDGGTLTGHGLVLQGEYGLLLARGEARLRDLAARGQAAGVASMHGALDLTRAAVTGPSREAAVSVAGGTARLSQVVLRDPGPTGLAISGGDVEARDLSVAGAREPRELGACVLVRRATLRLSASELTRCGGAAVEASRARVSLDGVDAAGGEVGCLAFTDHSTVDLAATLCTRRGPGLVAMEGSTVKAFGARFWTDPALWVDCGSGARVALLGEPAARQPCAPRR